MLQDAFQKGKMAVVSFPGVHGCGWNELTRVSCKHGSKLVTSCVFLPDGNAPGYGEHVPYKKGCHCDLEFADDILFHGLAC